MLKKHFLLFAIIFVAQTSYATIVPKNNLKIYPGDKYANLMTEELFNDVLEKVEDIYKPIVKVHGGNLRIYRLWNDATVNAYASQTGTMWKVAMFGGLARHHTITTDALYAVACHEIGHHIGGMPRYGLNKRVMSTEGQSDYFGFNKCLKKVWANENNELAIQGIEFSVFVKESCQTHKRQKDYNLCLRSSLAAQSLANLFAALRKVEPGQLHTRNTNVVKKVFEKHPETQCRLDTYFAGAVCSGDLGISASQDNVADGNCFNMGGLEYHKEDRPLCWFYDNGSEFLNRSIKNFDHTKLQAAINLGAKLSETNSEGLVPLEYSIQFENEVALEELLKAGADTKIENLEQQSLAHLVVLSNKASLLDILYTYNVSLGQFDRLGLRPVHYAARDAKKAMVEGLIGFGVTIDEKTRYQSTPLMYATKTNINFVQFLIDLGASIHIRNRLGTTPLIQSVMHARIDILELLQDLGANINQPGYNGLTALHYSVSKKNPALVRSLLKRGANKYAKNKKGERAYDTAIRRKASKEIQRLVK